MRARCGAVGVFRGGGVGSLSGWRKAHQTHDSLEREWWDGIRADMSAALPVPARAEWVALRDAEIAAGRSLQRAEAAANAAHARMRDALLVHDGRRAWSLGSSDEDVRNQADALASRCDGVLSRVRRAAGDLLDTAAAEARARLDVLAREYRCAPARGDDLPALARYACPKWWRRSLRKAQRVEIEVGKIRAGVIRKGRQVYCSDAQVRLRRNQNLRNRQTLEAVQAINDEGDAFTLAELADLSVSNPAIRRCELMVRMRGFEDYAKARGHVARALTLTCPSWMHPNDSDYQGITPAQAQAWLNVSWQRTRAAAGRTTKKRAAIPFYGFRVAEPHKDGCPHWHAVLFFESDAAAREFKAIVRRKFLRDVYENKANGGPANYERGAARVRVKVETIRSNATGYLAKYIAKNIDGMYQQAAHPDLFEGDALQGFTVRADGDGGEYYGKSIELSERVQAWATCWRIRQFQQVGGPPVTLWREFRRVEGELAGDVDLTGVPFGSYLHAPELSAAQQCDVMADEFAEKLRAPCDGTRWSGLCDAWADVHGYARAGTTPNVPKKYRVCRPVYWVPDAVMPATGEVVSRMFTQYGDVRAGQVAGAEVFGKFFGTRLRQWEIKYTAEQVTEKAQASAAARAAAQRAAEAVSANGAAGCLGVLSITVREPENEESAEERIFRLAMGRQMPKPYRPATMEEAERVMQAAFARQLERMRRVGYLDGDPACMN